LLDQIDRLVPKREIRAVDKTSMRTTTAQDMPAISMPSGHILNDATLASLEIMGKRSSFIPDLINGFLQDTEILLNDMKTALRDKRLEDFRDLVHAMKGSAGSVGAQTLYDACIVVGEMQDETLIKETTSLMHDLVTQYESARYELLAYLERRAAG
jgi:two-component system sensor histidine kinase RpfC